MSHTSNLGAYNDVRAVLDIVLREGGGIYTLPSRREAYSFRARIYAFRRILQKEYGGSDYDQFAVSLEETKLIFRLLQPTGKFTAPDGRVVEIEVPDKLKEIETEVDELVKNLNLNREI